MSGPLYVCHRARARCSPIDARKAKGAQDTLPLKRHVTQNAPPRQKTFGGIE
ncbi:hypothetical protein NAS141_18919 [Sulfitobacter sp. NAS-14.1]|nr:hypothetical protein NAS141_18919 [Sulfitobacter sp. NAS-14.1]